MRNRTLTLAARCFSDGTHATTSVRYGLGARGVDCEQSATGTYYSNVPRSMGAYGAFSYPLYDAHGNRICALTRYGSGYYSTDTPRFMDAWGKVISGSSTGGSNQRYCANLAHVQDDESGMVYMRARYYEPETGRLISEDPAGGRWPELVCVLSEQSGRSSRRVRVYGLYAGRSRLSWYVGRVLCRLVRGISRWQPG